MHAHSDERTISYLPACNPACLRTWCLSDEDRAPPMSWFRYKNNSCLRTSGAPGRFRKSFDRHHGEESVDGGVSGHKVSENDVLRRIFRRYGFGRCVLECRLA
eukprot:TRINITY_DN1082_c0_g1_i3.p1 TRINITY_DN1082_c0_g1~~TRINITY_DN1082_c0_g1_i3.p1  ORF type:complete len:103 (-),score=6.72 TRINITY_DN1082_c0_g1_i3:413-721(-)